jgi:hypothetical protein
MLRILAALILVSGCGPAEPDRIPRTIPIKGEPLWQYHGRWYNPESSSFDMMISASHGQLTYLAVAGTDCEPSEAHVTPTVITFRSACSGEWREGSLQYLSPQDGEPAVLMGHLYWLVRDPSLPWRIRNSFERRELTPRHLRESFIDWAAERW